jgi:hypothetical protein
MNFEYLFAVLLSFCYIQNVNVVFPLSNRGLVGEFPHAVCNLFLKFSV